MTSKEYQAVLYQSTTITRDIRGMYQAMVEVQNPFEYKNTFFIPLQADTLDGIKKLIKEYQTKEVK